MGALPDVFIAHTTHVQTIRELPARGLRLAENPVEAHHAFRFGKNAWGVQFHPEFSAGIMSAYVSEQTTTLLNEGHDVAALQAAICNTEASNALIKRFMTIVQENMSR